MVCGFGYGFCLWNIGDYLDRMFCDDNNIGGKVFFCLNDYCYRVRLDVMVWDCYER